MTAYDVVVLAGGAARRLGGADKPGVRVGGRALLDRVLAACADARTTVVVADPRPTARPVTWAREDPPGGGPLAALGAGLHHTTAQDVVVLSADLPFLAADTVRHLLTALRTSDADGALLTDAEGRDQPLVAAYRADALRRELAVLAAAGAGAQTARGVGAGTGPADGGSDAPASGADDGRASAAEADTGTRPGARADARTAPGARTDADAVHEVRTDAATTPGGDAAPGGGPVSTGVLAAADSRGPAASTGPASTRRPAAGTLTGLPLRRLTASLHLTRVPDPVASFDCDTWDDIAAARARIREHGHVLDEWISAVKDELGIDLDVDTGVLLDLARDAAHNVARPAAPLTTFLVGYAAAQAGGGPEKVAELARKAADLALGWSEESAPGAEPKPGTDAG